MLHRVGSGRVAAQDEFLVRERHWVALERRAGRSVYRQPGVGFHRMPGVGPDRDLMTFHRATGTGAFEVKLDGLTLSWCFRVKPDDAMSVGVNLHSMALGPFVG
jgi:hypothetical protein